MKRKAVILFENELKTIAVCIDKLAQASIYEYINQDETHRKKFRYIVQLILNRIRMPDVYDKENINEKCKDITAMKFFKNGSNGRIYCKEKTVGDKKFVVIMAEVLEKKKTQKNNNKINNIINKIAGYEYEIENENG